jgi:peptide/nickel transport system substrate-binding protein
MVPGIASDWEISPDGLTTTFTIREGVKWHDGSDLTVDDVLWTLQHQMGPEAQNHVVASDLLVLSGDMDHIELAGPNQVSVVTTQPHLELLNIMSEVSGQWFHMMPAREELYNEAVEVAYDQNPIGAGPMSFVEHVPADHMSFERFEDFYYQPANGFPIDKRVTFQRLDMYLVPEEATRVAALRAGDADIAPASLATKAQVEAGGGRFIFAPEGVFLEVRLMGCWREEFPCHDKRVRQALDYAINKELIQNRVYGGPDVFGLEGWASVTPSTIGYTPELDWPYDPDKARQLLADAGYPNGEGFGKLIINTAPAISAPFIVEVAQLLAEFWKRDLGIDAEVRVSDTTALRGMERARELDGQIWFRDNEARVDALDTMLGRFGDPEHPTRLTEDPEIVSMVRKVAGIVDPEKRAQALEELYPRLREESYMLGVGYLNISWGVGPRVKEWRPYPVSLYPSALYTLVLE